MKAPPHTHPWQQPSPGNSCIPSWPGDGACELQIPSQNSQAELLLLVKLCPPQGGDREGVSPSAVHVHRASPVAWGAQISPWVEGILIGNLSTWLIFGVSKAQRISHSVLKGACSKRASRRMELFGSWGWKCLGQGVPIGECSFLGEHAGLGPSCPPSVDQEERGVDHGGSLFCPKCGGKTPFCGFPISARSFGSL